MTPSFRLFPESASTFADRVDQLYFFLIVVSVFFTGLICALIVTFGVRYRRHSRALHQNISGNIRLEIAWAVAALALTMVMFFRGAQLFSEIRTPPAGTLDINVVAKQWMWKLQHPEGRAEINELHIPIHQPIRLNMISQDVIHSFYVPAFRVKQDVLPNNYSSLWFQATQTGRFHLFCAEYCGTEHSKMRGTVIAMSPEDYSNWLSGATSESPVAAGQHLFERFRCGSCHKDDGRGPGPDLTGLYGSRVALEGGSSVTANEQYLRDSIVRSEKQIVAGYRPLMPLYQGQLNETEILNLIAYIRSFANSTRANPADNDDRDDNEHDDGAL